MYRLSKWDQIIKDEYISSPEALGKNSRTNEEYLDSLGLSIKAESGEAAFYGPKLVFKLRKYRVRRTQIIRIQIDFSFLQRLDLILLTEMVKRRLMSNP